MFLNKYHYILLFNVYPLHREKKVFGKYLIHSWPVGVQLCSVQPTTSLYESMVYTEITNMQFSLITSGLKHGAQKFECEEQDRESGC